MASDTGGTVFERDVVIVGGGPAGSSAAVFTARYGLDTVVFDRGNAALRRCAFLSNYLGFPAGIDVGTFYDLMHAHVVEAGADHVADTVESVERAGESGNRSESDRSADDRSDDPPGFLIETADGGAVTARYVIAAAWYDGAYLRPLCGEAAFETHEHHGEIEERFDPDYPDADGRTPVERLYVAAPSGGRNAQAIISAGQGAHVARSLLEDRRSDRGFPEGVLAAHYDWLRPESEFQGEWGDRDRWREWFENEAGEDHGLSDDRFVELREAYIDRAFETRLEEDAVEERTERGLNRVVETVGVERVLDAVGDERIREYLEAREATEEQ